MLPRPGRTCTSRRGSGLPDMQGSSNGWAHVPAKAFSRGGMHHDSSEALLKYSRNAPMQQSKDQEPALCSTHSYDCCKRAIFWVAACKLYRASVNGSITCSSVLLAGLCSSG